MPTFSALLDKSSLAFVSDYLPRRCGIATFTHDLCEAVAKRGGKRHDVFSVAMNDVPEGYPYTDRVRFEVRQSVQADYRLAAEFLNIHQVSAVCLQHEYGIFGGPSGSHILSLLRRLRRPLVTTLLFESVTVTNGQMKLFQVPSRLTMQTTPSIGLASGSPRWRKSRQPDAPSIRADSNRSSGIDAK